MLKKLFKVYINKKDIIRRKLRIYLPFVYAGMQETATYRTDWFFRILGNSLGCIVSYFLWNAIFISSSRSVIKGFTITQMALYIFLVFLTSTIIYSEGIYNIGDEIRTGSIALRIIKPVSYNSSLLFHEFGNKVMTTYFIILPIIFGLELYRYFLTSAVQFSFFSFVLYIISCLLAYLTNFFFNICFGFIGFFTNYLWGVNMIKNTIVGFLSGSTIPFSFLPAYIEKLLTFLPFASFTYTPVMIYLNIYTSTKTLLVLGLQLFWLLVFWLLSRLLWKISMKHICIQGG